MLTNMWDNEHFCLSLTNYSNCYNNILSTFKGSNWYFWRRNLNCSIIYCGWTVFRTLHNSFDDISEIFIIIDVAATIYIKSHYYLFVKILLNGSIIVYNE